MGERKGGWMNIRQIGKESREHGWNDGMEWVDELVREVESHDRNEKKKKNVATMSFKGEKRLNDSSRWELSSPACSPTKLTN